MPPTSASPVGFAQAPPDQADPVASTSTRLISSPAEGESLASARARDDIQPPRFEKAPSEHGSHDVPVRIPRENKSGSRPACRRTPPGHRRGRTAVAGDVQQHGFHESSLGGVDDAAIRTAPRRAQGGGRATEPALLVSARLRNAGRRQFDAPRITKGGAHTHGEAPRLRRGSNSGYDGGGICLV